MYNYSFIHCNYSYNLVFRLKWSLTNTSSSLRYFSKTRSEMRGSDRITWEHSRNLSDLMWHRHGGFYYCHQMKLTPLIPEANLLPFGSRILLCQHGGNQRTRIPKCTMVVFKRRTKEKEMQVHNSLAFSEYVFWTGQFWSLPGVQDSVRWCISTPQRTERFCLINSKLWIKLSVARLPKGDRFYFLDTNNYAERWRA